MKILNVITVVFSLCRIGECAWFSRNFTAGDFTTKINDIEKNECVLYCKKYPRCETFATEMIVPGSNCYINNGLAAPSIHLNAGSTIEIWAKGKCVNLLGKFSFFCNIQIFSC